jgi:hypothetical protein
LYTHPEIELMFRRLFAYGGGEYKPVLTSSCPSYLDSGKIVHTDTSGATGMEPVQHYLARRANWQAAAQAGGARAEKDSCQIIRDYLETTYPGEFAVSWHPHDLRQIYYEYDYERNPEAYAKPAVPTSEHIWYDAQLKLFATTGGSGLVRPALGGGCIIDCAIEHINSGKKYYIECKNQEDKGNAHERAAKYATPSIIAHVQKKLGVSYQPFGYLFTGGMVESKPYIVELKATYGFAPDHLFLWKKEHEPAPLLEWLERVVLPLLR